MLWKLKSTKIPYILFDGYRAYMVEQNHVDAYNQNIANEKMWILIDSIAFPEGLPPEAAARRAGNVTWGGKLINFHD